MVGSLGSVGNPACCSPQPSTGRRIWEGELDHQLPPLPEQGGQPSIRRDPVAEIRQWGIDTKWETHRGGTHLLGLWTQAPGKLRCQATPGERRSWAVMDLGSGSLWTVWKAVGLLRKAGSCFVRNPRAASSGWLALRVILAA